MSKSLYQQIEFEDKCHEEAFKGTDHLSRSVHTQLIPAFSSMYTSWLEERSAGKGGKLKSILRKSAIPLELLANIVLKRAFLMVDTELTTVVNDLTRNFIIEEEYQSTLKAIKDSQVKSLADKTAFQINNKPTYSSKKKHMEKCRTSLGNIEDFDKDLYSGVGVIFIDILTQIRMYTQGEEFNVFTIDEARRAGKNKTSRLIIHSDQFNQWFNNKCHNVIHSAFNLMPTLVKPNRWDDLVGGGYYTQRGNLHWTLIRNTDLRHYKAEDIPQDLYDAVNNIQETPWAINKEVYSVMNWMFSKGFDLGGLTSYTKPDDLFIHRKALRNTVSKDEWAKLSQQERGDVVKARDARVKKDKVDQSKSAKHHAQLNMARDFAQYSEFFFPHALDFRGRVYPIPCPVHPQSDSFGQALLKFAHGEPLGNEGRYWLAVHGANTFGNDKVSFNDRVAFIEDKTEEIKLIALDALKMRSAWCPMDDKGKCTVDDPWGYLAFCFEWAKMSNMSDHTKFVSHLPVKLDATCSGLQHFSAMLRDEFGATATNVGDNTTRNDIYTLAGDATKKAIENELVCIIKPEEKQLKRSFIPVLKNRKIPKNPCMTLPYGVSTFGITDKLIEQAEEGLLDEAYVDAKSNSKEKLGHYRWFAQKLEEGVSTVVPSAVEAMDWLKACDKILSKSLQPSEYYEFISPIGLPVKQCSLKQHVKRINGFFGVEKIRIQYTAISNKPLPTPQAIRRGASTDVVVNRAKSQTSIAPNFVHAQDASHLCNVAVRVRQELGLKSCSFIHDSFGVHPSETSAFLRVIKEEFHKLYTGDRLNEVKEYWEETYKVELPAPPAQGTFNIDSVLNSVFIFS